MGLSSTFTKYRNFLALNLLILGCGVVFLSLASLITKLVLQVDIILVAYETYHSILGSFLGICAVAIFSSTAFGCYGALLRRKHHIRLFQCCLVLGIVVQIALTVVTNSYVSELSSNLEKLVVNAADTRGQHKTSETVAVAYDIQRSFECCGYEGPTSWRPSSRATNESTWMRTLLPESCCPKGDASRCIPASRLAYGGCKSPFERTAHGYFIGTAVTCAVLCLLQVAGFVYGFFLL